MLLGSTLSHLPASSQAYLTGHSFFPSLISAPFSHGLQIAFDFSIACCLVAAVASLLRGKHYVHDVHAAGEAAPGAAGAATAGPETAGAATAGAALAMAATVGAGVSGEAADGQAPAAPRPDGRLANKGRVRL